MQIRFSPFFVLLCVHRAFYSFTKSAFEKTWEVEVVKSFQSLNLLTFHREALEEGAVLTRYPMHYSVQ